MIWKRKIKIGSLVEIKKGPDKGIRMLVTDIHDNAYDTGIIHENGYHENILHGLEKNEIKLIK